MSDNTTLLSELTPSLAPARGWQAYLINVNGTAEFRVPLASILQLVSVSDLPDLSGVYAPVVHTHEIADVNGLQVELDAALTQPEADLLYAPVIHTHEIADINGLQAALDGAFTQDDADYLYAPLAHLHDIADINGLQVALDACLTPAEGDVLYAPIVHGHAIGDITGLQGSLDSKLPIVLNGIPVANQTGIGFETDSFWCEIDTLAGQVLYLDSTTGRWKPASANGVATGGKLLAIAMQTVTATPAPVRVLLQGFYRNDAWNWLAPGDPVYLSSSLASLASAPPTAPDSVMRVAGFAVTSDVIWFAPSSDWFTHV